MTYQDILYEVDGGIATITLNRPAKLNAVSFSMLEELIDAYDRADIDDDVRAIVVTATGRAFSAGTDISPGGGGLDVDSPDYRPLNGAARDVGGTLALRIFDCRKLVVAAYNGISVGIGITMTLPADVRIAVTGARFQLPFAHRGIVPESCSTWFLPRVVGISRAVEWAASGRWIDDTEALAAGLVTELVEPDRLLERAREIAVGSFTASSAVSVALIRQMMWRLLGAPHPDAANVVESEALKALVGAPDDREGVASFRERRPARFSMSPTRDLPDVWHSAEPT